MQTGVLLRELTRLKLRLTIRHYRKQIGNTIALVIAWIGMGFGVLAGSIVLAMYLSESSDPAEAAAGMLVWIFWILSIIWMFTPFAQVDAQRNLDLNGMRSYPLSGSQFLLVVIFDALLSPLSLFVLPFTLIFFGVVVFAGMPLLPILLSLLLCVAILLCYTQGIFLLVNRLLQSRRFAEMSMLAGIFIVVIVQVVNFSFLGGIDNIGGDFSHSPLARWLAPLKLLADYCFPSLAAGAALHWHSGDFLRAVSSWGMMLLWLLPGVLFVGRTARAFYEGELESGGVSGERSGRQRGLGLAGLLPAGLLQTLVLREQRYAKRDPMLRSLLIQSMFFGLYSCVILLVLRGRILSGGDAPVSGNLMNYVLLGLSMMLTYSESGVMFNRFGYEGASMASLLASPVSRRQVLVAKSYFLLTHLGGINLLLVLMTGSILRCDPLFICAALVMIIANIVIVDMAGNFLSILYPFGFVRKGNRVRAVMPQQGCGYILLYGLLFNVCNLFVAPGSLMVVVGTVFYGWPGMLGGMLFAWALAALIWYVGLGHASQLLESREQRLLENLSREPD